MTAAIIPCYKVKRHILEVIKSIGPEVKAIYVVDDCCPEESGLYVEQLNKDPRVKVIFNPSNKGVGGAVMNGYRQAIADGYKILVKIDGDGQMPAHMIPEIIAPISDGHADYVKGNRFYNIDTLTKMPKIRVLGNSALSFISKASSGYWHVMDPTNGFTALSAQAAQQLPFDKISERYFFESDILFRLNTINAVVKDLPHEPIYGDEISNLKISKIIFSFSVKHLKNFCKRIFYTYFLRDFNPGTIQLLTGLVLIISGTVTGAFFWTKTIITHQASTSGQVMLSGLPIILGFQSLLAAVTYDVNNIPKTPLTKPLTNGND